MHRTLFALTAALACGALGTPVAAERNLARPPGTTRYAPMVAQLQALLHYDRTVGPGRMQLADIGRSVDGRRIWIVTLHSSPEAAGDETAQPSQAPKTLLYLCRQHGHEPASTEGALHFINALEKAPDGSVLANELQDVTVCVVPMANPDGAEAFLRHNAHDVDLNRDWLRRTQPETQAWYREVLSLHPDLMTDQHELYPNDTRPDFTEVTSTSSGASSEVIAECTAAQAAIKASMDAAGTPVVSHTIIDHHPARLAHRYASIVLDVPTVLFETNRLTGSARTVAARAHAHYEFMVAALQFMAATNPAQPMSPAPDQVPAPMVPDTGPTKDSD